MDVDRYAATAAGRADPGAELPLGEHIVARINLHRASYRGGYRIYRLDVSKEPRTSTEYRAAAVGEDADCVRAVRRVDRPGRIRRRIHRYAAAAGRKGCDAGAVPARGCNARAGIGHIDLRTSTA